MKVFISYSRIDASETANTIHKYLTEIGHHEVFIDTLNIRGGDKWRNTIHNEISNCDIFVIIVTQTALRRNEVKKEVELAKNLEKRIIPCIAKKYVHYEDLQWDLNNYEGIMFEGKDDLINQLGVMIPPKVDDSYSILDKKNSEETDTSSSLLEKAKGLEGIGQYPKALKIYEEIIKNNPNNFEAYYNKGLLHYKIGDFKSSSKALDKASDIDYGHNDVWYHLGMALEKLEKYEEALNKIDSDLSLDDKDIKSWFTKANILIKLKRYKEAIEAFDEIIKLDPNNKDAKGNKEEVIKELTNQEFSTLIKEIAFKFQNKDYSNVIELCNKAIVIDQNNPILYIYKGNSLNKLKRDNETVECYDKALQLLNIYKINIKKN